MTMLKVPRYYNTLSSKILLLQMREFTIFDVKRYQRENALFQASCCILLSFPSFYFQYLVVVHRNTVIVKRLLKSTSKLRPVFRLLSLLHI